MAEVKYQKPSKWKPRSDPKCCIACPPFVAFKRGDMVYRDGCVALHERCLAEYGRQLKELGLR